MKKVYKFLAVSPATHKKIAVAAKEKAITIDMFLNQLLKPKQYHKCGKDIGACEKCWKPVTSPPKPIEE